MFGLPLSLRYRTLGRSGCRPPARRRRRRPGPGGDHGPCEGTSVRVAVTGATGVIGSAVVPPLVEAGHDVVGLARPPAKARALLDRGASPVSTSLLDHDGLVAMFEGADAVCNFATHVP